jgi:hypothetical protein
MDNFRKCEWAQQFIYKTQPNVAKKPLDKVTCLSIL